MVNRVVIVGHGYFGSLVRERVKDCKHLELVGVVDPDYDRLKGLEGLTVADSYGKFADNVDHDSVIVCAPSKLHAPISVTALKLGKNVMCQKPGALSRNEVNWITNAWESGDSVFCVDYTPRNAPEFSYILDALQAHGDLYTSTFLRHSPFPPRPEGEVFDLMPHDIALWLSFDRRLDPGDDDGNRVIDVSASYTEAGVSATISQKDGAQLAYFSARYNARMEKIASLRVQTHDEITNPLMEFAWNQSQKFVSVRSQGRSIDIHFRHDPDPITASLHRFAWRCDYKLSDLATFQEVSAILFAISCSLKGGGVVEVELPE